MSKKEYSSIFDRIPDCVKETIPVLIGIAAMGSFFSGCLLGGDAEGCPHKNIVTKYNIPYYLGCELFKERFGKRSE